MSDTLDVTAEELGIEDPETYNRETRQKLQAALDEETMLGPEAREARDALLGDGPETATVDLAAIDERLTEPVEIEVRTDVPGTVTDALEAVEDADRLSEKVEHFITAIEAMVVGPPGYTEREAWADVYRQRGAGFISECLAAIMEPAADLDEAVESFRDDAAGPG